MFPITIKFRTFGNVEKDIREIIRANPVKYYNVSHFIRTAVFRLIKEEKEKKN